MAAPVHAAHAATAATLGVTSLAVTTPSGVVASSTCAVSLLLEVTFGNPDPTGVTPPASGGTWTQVGVNKSTRDGVSGADYVIHVVYEYRAVAAESGTWTFTWTNTAASARASAHRITGAVSSATIFDPGFDQEITVADSVNAPTTSLVTAGADRLLLWLCGGVNGGSAWTPPTGLTEVFEASNLTAAWKVQDAQGGSGSLVGSNEVADRKVAFLGAVVPAATPGPLASPALLIQQGLWRPWLGGDPATPDVPAVPDVEVPYVLSQYGGFF